MPLLTRSFGNDVLFGTGAAVGCARPGPGFFWIVSDVLH